MSLSFILPFTLKEVVTRQLSWRDDTNIGAEVRFRLLIYSFLKSFDQMDLDAFIIVSPFSECQRIEAILRSVTADHRYNVIPEHLLCPEICAKPQHNQALAGWHIQQIIKMAVAELLVTDFYVTLDSDILCLRKVKESDLIVQTTNGPKGIVNTETEKDYTSIYRSSFVSAELRIKRARYCASLKLLGKDVPEDDINRFFGETPCVIHRASMLSLLVYLSKSMQKPWQEGLAGDTGWTEYSLYFQYLEFTGLLEDIYQLAGCNQVLDLERSVWQENSWYLSARDYDQAHFSKFLLDRTRGPFVAIQSWLPTNSWLPKGCQSIFDFYDRLSSWL
jgi:Family of unknown function (DUF6492)